jgi:TrmH family RNA methyltransferase
LVIEANLRFVLVEPQSAGNIGAAARALMNLGFSRLLLVNPQCDHLGHEAVKMAVDARSLLESAEVHDELGAALAGAATVVGTSRRMGKHRRPHWRIDTFAGDLVRLASAAECAILFGREDHGLSDRELDLCTHLVHLPAADVYPSFNLSQAVLLTAYELRMAGSEEPPSTPLPRPADHPDREAMYRHLERALLAIGFISDDTTEVIMRRFRRMLGRKELTAEEVKLLRGVARQTLWAAEQAGLDIPEE